MSKISGECPQAELSPADGPPRLPLHNQNAVLSVSYDPASQVMVVGHPGTDRYFNRCVVTPNSLWDLLVEFADHPEVVYKREVGVAMRWAPPTPAEQQAFMDAKLNISLDDLDLEL